MDKGKLFEDNQALVGLAFRKLSAAEDKDFLTFHKEDLMQEGLIGLWKAAESYDETRGIQFSTYAMHCIENEMGQYRRQLRRKKSCTNVVSTDELIRDQESGYLTLGDTIPAADKEDVTWITESPLLSERQREIARLLYQRYTQEEIGEKVGVCRTMVCREIKKIAQILRGEL